MIRVAAAAALIAMVLLSGPHPAAADAVCMDNTHSSADGTGACSHHGGVRQWLPDEPAGSSSGGFEIPSGLLWFVAGVAVGAVLCGHIGMLLRRRRATRLAPVQDIERHAS